MAHKISRNDPCWCGSGKKYKKCHLNRDKMPAPNIFEVAKSQRKFLNKKYCLHPNAGANTCKGGIIKAHTIQRSGVLNKIARDGHVYGLGFHFDVSDITKNQGNIKPKLIGINEASTFTGFCNLHDTNTFAPIENNPFESNQEHTFLVAYKAVCRELFAKRIQKESIPFSKSLDQGMESKRQMLFQSALKSMEIGSGSGLQSLEKIKKIYDQFLIEKDYSKIKYYILRIKQTPEMMCSAGKYPVYDFQGNKLQNLSDLSIELDSLTFSIFASGTGGVIVFSWINENHGACTSLIKSLNSFTDEEMPHAVLRFAIGYFENIYFSPIWWENLKPDAKVYIQNRFVEIVHPMIPYRNDFLMDMIFSWTIRSD